MNRSFVRLFAGLLLAGILSLGLRATEAAKVTLTVTQFRPLTTLEENRYVDATTTLAPHEHVALVTQNGMPTLICKGAVDFEIEVTSANAEETYVPLAITFQQFAEATGDKRDKSGARNFERLPAASGKLLFRNKALVLKPDGHYEFFVLIQRLSDGAIGLIDPMIIAEPRGP